MLNFDLRRKRSFGIDLGNNNTVVSDEQRVLLSQPSYIVLDSRLASVKAVGDEAYAMYDKTHPELKPIKPLRGGVIADFESATKMIREMVRQAHGPSRIPTGYDHIISSVPYHTTNVERRALVNALENLNARHTDLVFEPIAAAIGIGLNIQEPEGKMVVDIGGGITEIVVISLSGIVTCQSIKVAGDTMDEDIQRYFRKQHNIAIGIKTAEQIKILIGAVSKDLEETPVPILVKGKDLLRGLPVTREINHMEVMEILDKSIRQIEVAIIQTLEKCPPELAADIYESGIHVTGGNALLRGLQRRLEQKVKIPVHIDSDALLSVSKGVAKVLREPKKYRSVLVTG